MKYLTPELKKYYMDDFNNNVIKCTHEYWGLDDGLLKICIDINKNPNVQTVYSKKYQAKINEQPISYLWILFSKQTDTDKINKFIRECKSKFKYFLFEYEQKPNPIVNTKTGVKNLCLNDPNYLEHGFINILIHSEKLKDHKAFWSIINKHLKNW
jgi:hypothetical protein